MINQTWGFLNKHQDKINIYTLGYIVIIIFFFYTVWGSISAMQRNYLMQRQLTEKELQLKLVKLQVENLELEKAYYQTDEYKDLSARTNMGLATNGESVLILPPNSEMASKIEDKISISPNVLLQDTVKVDESNFSQWKKFLFGENPLKDEKNKDNK